MDIWQILGVAATSNIKEIRQAYAAKLKVTRPDKDPTGYQTLREAYDLALEIAAHPEPTVEHFDCELTNDFEDARQPEVDEDTAVADSEVNIFLDKLRSLLNIDPMAKDQAAWDILLNDEALTSFDLRTSIESECFYLLADHCHRLDTTSYSSPFGEVARRFAYVFGWDVNDWTFDRYHDMDETRAFLQLLTNPSERVTPAETQNVRQALWEFCKLIAYLGYVVAMVMYVFDLGPFSDEDDRESEPRGVASAKVAVSLGEWARAISELAYIAEDVGAAREQDVLLLAKACVGAGDYATAEALLNVRIELFPSGNLYLARASLLFLLDEPAYAREDLITAADTQGNSFYALKAAANFLSVHPEANMRDPKRALTYARKAKRFGPSNDWDLLKILANAEAQNGNAEAAIKHYRNWVSRTRREFKPQIVEDLRAGRIVRTDLKRENYLMWQDLVHSGK